MQIYKDIGYRVLEVSSYTKEGLEALTHALIGCISIFAGQSGVGNRVLSILFTTNGRVFLVNHVSDNQGLDNIPPPHRAFTIFPLGGDVIDSPGYVNLVCGI